MAFGDGQLFNDDKTALAFCICKHFDIIKISAFAFIIGLALLAWFQLVPSFVHHVGRLFRM